MFGSDLASSTASMATRPSRVTRSSAAATSAGSATAAPSRQPRTGGGPAALSAQSTSTANPPPTRRTTRSSRANTPAPVPEATAGPRTRVSTARTTTTSTTTASTSTTRPQWGASNAAARSAAAAHHANVSTPPPSALKRPAGASLAVPGTAQRARTPGQGLLSRMTSRDSLRHAATKTPARTSSNSLDAYDGTREPIKVRRVERSLPAYQLNANRSLRQAYLRIRPAPEGVPLQSYIQVLNETDVLMVPPAVSHDQQATGWNRTARSRVRTDPLFDGPHPRTTA